MREWLHCDHEERSAHKLAAVRAALTPGALRQMSWLDWDEVADLVRGAGTDGRGALLNGRLDYDNADNVGRFLFSSGLARPAYDPVALARALRLVPTDMRDAYDAHGSRHEPAYLLLGAEQDALAWQAARGTLYGYLHEDHTNIALHAMLRKAIEMAFADGALPDDFLDMTDEQALAHLEQSPVRGVRSIAQQVRSGIAARYQCVLEAEMPTAQAGRAPVASWQDRLGLDLELAGESGLAPHEVIAEVLVSGAGRALPPLSPGGRPGTFTWLPTPLPAQRVLHLLVAPQAPRDYRRRLLAAGERWIAALGLTPRHSADGQG
jgi:hypothetical protein